VATQTIAGFTMGRAYPFSCDIGRDGIGGEDYFWHVVSESKICCRTVQGGERAMDADF
jgi:hypothetical protein